MERKKIFYLTEGKQFLFFQNQEKYLKHIKEKNIIDKIETKLNSLS